jgi:thiamine-phosphate pyrophosphorylase
MVAIGGIDETNAPALAKAGCDGIAVVSAVMKASDPASACRRLRSAFDGKG